MDQSLCRVCLLSDSKGFTLTQRTELNNEYSFLEMFNACTHLEALELDELPQIICQDCSNDLHIAFEFMNKAAASDQILRNHYRVKIEENTTNVHKIETNEEVEEDTFDQLDSLKNENLDEVSSVQYEYEDLTEIPKPGENQSNKNGFDGQFEQFVKAEFVSSENFYVESNRDFLYDNDEGIEPNIEEEQKEQNPSDSQTSSKCENSRECGTYVECKNCGKLLKQLSIKHHLKRCQKEEKIHLCSSCPKSFAVRSDLRNHMRTHETDRVRRYMCSQCGKGFFEKQSLKVHISRHMGEKDFHCPVCPKQFTTKKSLNVHMFTHNRQLGKFICKHCNKRFTSKADLIVHERFHTGDYPFQCEFCDKSFAVKSHYNYHLAKHQGVTYKCDKCDKEFLNRGSLTAHKFKHNDRMPHECPICKKGFASPYKLNRHKSSHKPKEEDRRE